ncbi:ATP-binding protein [Sphingobacterium phlebotomi]|uniref:ATP-binding protein n=1 Tax=Sphingobacterium phlebotomi TaxID=2605433 RepID=A0A5D4H385_9SPHI|nr:ATP-binding protein [Sphingobacterium phlebotomi]TYR33905.1 ATP-binding protein [Sphingobacterium phlebotomi]
MIERTIKNTISAKLFKGKTIILIGARQVGKTTLIREVLKGAEFLFLDGDDPLVREKLTNPNTKEIESIIGNSKIVFIDEAQRIENIGLTAKIIHDQFKAVQLIMSGSSAFELRNQTNEPLTGRKFEHFLFPVSYEEYEKSVGYLDATRDIENRLIYGFYPDVINNIGEEREILNEITQSYLFKDILSFSNIKKPEILEKILQALAFQVGSEVSYNEIAQLTGVDKNTVSSYIHLLELSYIIYPLTSFSRNLRNEIKTNRKIYFYDNGIRNALIHNFNPIGLRNDIGALWENFLMSERLKRNHYHQRYCNKYFWRTKQQQEMDYVEESNGEIIGFEFKWNPKAKVNIPSSFVKAYQADVHVVTKENFRDFIMNAGDER